MANPADPAASLPSLSYLIIEDSPTMRAALRITITTLGGTRIDMTGTFQEALFKLVKQGRQYDVILCDYHLNDSRDGQQLLEELRFRKMLPHRCIFIMVTSETGYQRVVQVVEHAPDDYMIKPFPGRFLQERLVKQIRKKRFFAPVFAALEADDPAAALAVVDQLLGASGAFEIELMRLKAEILTDLHLLHEARLVYEAVLARHPFPWAKFGLARLAYHLRDLGEARRLLEEVIEAAPRYLTARDFLTQVHAELGDHAQALVVADETAQLGERNVVRQRQRGRLALIAQELDKADAAFQSMLEHGRNSVHLVAADYVAGSATAAALGRAEDALRLLREAERTYGTDEVLAAGKLAVASQISASAGDAEKARASLQALTESLASSSDAGMQVVSQAALRSAATLGDDVLIEQMMGIALRHGDGEADALAQVTATLQTAGKEDLARKAEELARREVADLNNRAVEMAKGGQLREAMALLIRVARKPSATSIAQLNAAQAVLMCLDAEGWDDGLMRECQLLIGRVAAREPDNPKLLKLRQMTRLVAQKFGVKA